MKYNVYLINGMIFENVTRGFWEQLAEPWRMRYYKMPDGTYRYVPISSILYYIPVKK